MTECRIASDTRTSQLRREERQRLVTALCAYTLPWTGDEGYKKAEVTGGGVALSEVDPRTLESRHAGNGRIEPGEGTTELFIRPGHRFEVVDAMITNFHLPRSTLLMLVAAFAGRERVLSAYCDAVDHGYRFYSYGDAMLIR